MKSPHRQSSNESDLLAHIFSLAGGINAQEGDVLVGPGDDCAVVRTLSGDRVLLSVDQLVAGRHFVADTPVDQIARKAVARSISDIAAMGGTPRWCLATGLLPDGYTWAKELSEALLRWGRHWNAPVVGGDIAFGPGPLSLTVTAVGSMDQPALPTGASASPILRSDAHPGDLLWLTGPIGGSFASAHHLHFAPRLDAGWAAAQANALQTRGESKNRLQKNPVVHAMIDISDGLGRDAARIGTASGVELVIEAGSVPVHRDASGTLLPWREAFSAGEDYELLLAIAPEHGQSQETLPEPLARLKPPLLGPIGRVVASVHRTNPPGATIIDPSGNRFNASSFGYDHGQ